VKIQNLPNTESARDEPLRLSMKEMYVISTLGHWGTLALDLSHCDSTDSILSSTAFAGGRKSRKQLRSLASIMMQPREFDNIEKEDLDHRPWRWFKAKLPTGADVTIVVNLHQRQRLRDKAIKIWMEKAAQQPNARPETHKGGLNNQNEKMEGATCKMRARHAST